MIFFQKIQGILLSIIIIVFSSNKILSFLDVLSPYIVSAFSIAKNAFKNDPPNIEYSLLLPTVPHKPQNKFPEHIPMNGNTFIFFNLAVNSILDNVPFNSLNSDEVDKIPKVNCINRPLLSVVNLCIFPPFFIHIS